MYKYLPLLLLAFPARSSAVQPLALESVTPAAIAASPAVPVSPPARLVIPYRQDSQPADLYFNDYVLKAVSRLYGAYGLLGYDIKCILTHDIEYHTYGTVKARKPPLTMCVAAVMEVLLTAYEIYAQETGDHSPYEYLPKRSFEGLAVTDLKGHIWVNPQFNANGTADALKNFGMGETTPFEKLKPGAFVNINRTTKTGHAVVFLDFIDAQGGVQKEYNDSVIGFKYFSSQGRGTPGDGGFDFRYAVFSKYGCPEMPYKRDCNVIYSADQKWLNTGTMWSPKYWTHVMPLEDPSLPETVLNRNFFNGITTDD